MAGVVFLIGDVFGPNNPDGSFRQSLSLENQNLPFSRAQTPRPREVWGSASGNGTEPGSPAGAGSFDIFTDNRFIDVDIGAGEVNVQLDLGTYGSLDLAAEIQAKLQVVDATFFCVHRSDGKFGIGRSGSWTLLSNTGTHGGANADDGIYREIGFITTADKAVFIDTVGESPRHGTHTFVGFVNKGKANPQSVFAILGSDETAKNLATFNDVVLFGHTVDLGPTRSRWAASATVTITLSNRPDEDENRLQMAFTDPSGSVPLLQHWFWSWRHFDASKRHEVGMLRFPDVVQPASIVTVRTLRGHGLVDNSEPLSVDRYYGNELPTHYRIALGFEEWPEDDWRIVGHALRRNPASQPVVVLLNGVDIQSGTRLANEEADKGFALLTTILDKGLDNFQGQNASFIDSEMLFQQLR